MPPMKKPPVGASNRTVSSVYQPKVSSRDEDRSCNNRKSLEIFGGGPQTSPLLFSRTRSAWKDAFQCAESHLESSSNTCQEQDNIRVVASVSDTSVPSSEFQGTISRMDYSSLISTAAPSPRNGIEDDVSKWLADARTSAGSVKTSTSSVSRSLDNGSISLDINDLNQDACARRLSECSVAPTKITAEQEWDEVHQLRRESNEPGLSEELSEEAVSARAAQWGYRVDLKTTSHRGSGSGETERVSRLSWTTRNSCSSSGAGKSFSSTSGESTASSSFSSIIPGISKNVKEALASFQLAFVVCDALNPDYPVLYASAGFFSMTGYSAKEVVGRNCRFLQGQYTDALDIAKIRDALKDGNIFSGKILNYKKDGTPFWNLLTISPIKDDGGRLIKYIGMQAEVTEGVTFGKDMDSKEFPASVKKFLEAEGQNGKNCPPADAVVLSASNKSSFEKSDVQRPTCPRYSLSSTRQSLEVPSTANSPVQEHQAVAKLKAECAAFRAGTTGSDKSVGVPQVLAGESGCKSSKRSSALIKMFKKLNGRFALSKRGPRGCSDEDRFVMDDDNDGVSDSDDEDLERKQRRSSIYSSTKTSLGNQEHEKSSEPRTSRRNSSSEQRRDCTSTSNNPEEINCNIESPMRKERFGASYLTSGSGIPELGRSVIGYGRRSVQNPVVEGQGGLESADIGSNLKSRRHSLASVPSMGPSINFGGKSQFCIVHPTDSGNS